LTTSFGFKIFSSCFIFLEAAFSFIISNISSVIIAVDFFDFFKIAQKVFSSFFRVFYLACPRCIVIIYPWPDSLFHLHFPLLLIFLLFHHYLHLYPLFYHLNWCLHLYHAFFIYNWVIKLLAVSYILRNIIKKSITCRH